MCYIIFYYSLFLKQALFQYVDLFNNVDEYLKKVCKTKLCFPIFLCEDILKGSENFWEVNLHTGYVVMCGICIFLRTTWWISFRFKHPGCRICFPFVFIWPQNFYYFMYIYFLVCFDVAVQFFFWQIMSIGLMYLVYRK